MKRFLVAYRPNRLAEKLDLVFTVIVTDEYETATAFKLCAAGVGFRYLWAEREGILPKLVPPSAPFDFLPSAIRVKS